MGSFNQRARDSSSLERTKIPRRIVRFFVGFSFFWGSAHYCTLFAHRRESRVFPCIVCILCIVSRTCRGEAPPSCWRKTVLSLESPTGAFIAALRSQTRTCRGKAPPSCWRKTVRSLKSPTGGGHGLSRTKQLQRFIQMENIVIVLQIFRRFMYRYTNFWKFMDERNKLRLNYVI